MKCGEYRLVKACKEYPGVTYNNGICAEHTYIFWLAYGIIPGNDELIHHKNGIKTDNRPENLEIMKRSDHSRMHDYERTNGKKYVTLKCPICGVIFDKQKNKTFLQKGINAKNTFCSTTCANRGKGIAFPPQDVLKEFFKRDEPNHIPIKGDTYREINKENIDLINNILSKDNLKKKQLKYVCQKCGVLISKDNSSKLCKKCYDEKRSFLNNRDITKEKLEKMIYSNMSMLEIGKYFGVSDNAVRKWCKAIGLPYKKKDRKKE